GTFLNLLFVKMDGLCSGFCWDFRPGAALLPKGTCPTFLDILLGVIPTQQVFKKLLPVDRLFFGFKVADSVTQLYRQIARMGLQQNDEAPLGGLFVAAGGDGRAQVSA